MFRIVTSFGRPRLHAAWADPEGDAARRCRGRLISTGQQRRAPFTVMKRLMPAFQESTGVIVNI